jgi:SulP family sulfate permease
MMRRFFGSPGVRSSQPSTGGPAFRTQPAAPDAISSRLAGELSGGLASAITALAFALSFGLLAFAPLGVEHVHVGIVAGLTSAIHGQVVAGLVGRTVHPGSGPRASTSLMVGGLVAVLAADPALAPSPSVPITRIVAMAGLCVAVAGAMQLLFGVLRLGQFVRYVPYPFVAGFMCGVAGLILLEQVAPLTGLTPSILEQGFDVALRAIEPATLLVGLGTAAVIFAVADRTRSMPGVLVGLLAGCALQAAIATGLPSAELGPVVGPVPDGLAPPDALLPLLAVPPATLVKHLPALVATATIIAVVGTLESIFAAVVVDHTTDGRHDTRRELVAHGIANVVSGACGGVPVVYSSARALASWNAGGRTPLAMYIASTALALVAVFGGRLIAYVPVAVLSGIMITSAVGLVDRWARGLLSRLPAPGERGDHARALSMATVVVVAVVMMAFGFVPAIAAGLVMSVALLLVGMNRSFVGAIVDGTLRPSRRVWGGEDANRVQEARKRIRVVELEGPLFFGSAERLADRVEPFAGAVDAVVLDFRHVTSIDATGALLMERLTRRLERRGTLLLLAGVTPGGRHGRALMAHDAFSNPRDRHWFRDADKAVEYAELRALAREGRRSDEEIPLHRLPLFDRLAPDELAIVATHLTRREVPRGQVLFREGDPGDSLFVIAKGAVEISIATDAVRRSRIVTMAAGSMFGDVALIDHGPRSATAAVAETTVLYELSRIALLEDLATQHPAIAMQLLVALASHMSQRLRNTNDVLRRLDDARG